MSKYHPTQSNSELNRFAQRNEAYHKENIFEVQKLSTEKFAIELRKSHRMQNTAKRRALLGPFRASYIFSQPYKGNINISEIPVALIKSYPELASEEIPAIEKLDIIRNILIQESATEMIVESLNALMEIFGYYDEMPLEVIFRMGFVPLFIKYMDWKYSSSIVYPSAVCLTNISACDHYYVACLVNNKGLDALVSVISPRSLITSALSIKALGNITIDSSEFHKQTKNPQVLNKITNLLEESKEIHTELYLSLCFYIVTISNNYQSLTKSETFTLIQWIERLLDLEEPCITKDLLKAIYNFSCMPYACITSKKVLRFISENCSYYLSMRCIANIIYHSCEQAEYFLKSNVLDTLIDGANDAPNSSKAAYQCLSNIVISGHYSPILHHPKLSTLISGLISKDKKVLKEASYFFSYFSKHLDYKTWVSLISLGLLEAINQNLDTENDPELIQETLYICTYMFLKGKIESEDQGDISNRLIDEFEENECISTLEELMCHENSDISDFAKDIIEEYFPEYIKNQENLIETVSIFKFS